MKKFICSDCGVNTNKIGEFFYLKDSVWLSIMPNKSGFLCIDCIEKRLKRLLNRNDFTNSYINSPKFCGKSQRLLNRLEK